MKFDVGKRLQRVIGMANAPGAHEMVLAHSSYAKAAGLQSEISKQTVGRVAGSEVEYKRQMNLYRKDMMITISNVRREEKVLKKSMVRYSKKKRQNKIERRKREQEDLERDRKAQEHHLNVLMIWKNKEETTPVSENKIEVLPESENNNVVHIESIKIEEKEKNELEELDDSEDNTTKEQQKGKKIHNTITNMDLGVLKLPAIVEDNEQELNEEMENEIGMTLEREDSGFQEINETPNESVGSTSEFPHHLLAIPQLKPKKQVVSYADIIKLQHTSNTKKLFNLVNLLAKKHGITNENKKPTEIRNSSVLRGSTNETFGDPMLRTGQVFYPMKYGYVTDSDDNVFEDMSTNIQLQVQDYSRSTGSPYNNKTPEVASSKEVTPLPPLTSRPNSLRVESQNTRLDLVSSPKRMHKRNKSMPILVDDYNKMKRAHSERYNRSEDYTSNTYTSTRSTPSAPRKLAPLNGQSSSTNVYRNRSDSVSWSEAFGLLKGVHALNI